MKQYKGIIILLNLILLLVIFNSSLVEKEEILSEGKLVLLKLAPVDPRSLMQGDYMALRYEVANDRAVNEAPVRGYCVLMADENNVAAVDGREHVGAKGEHVAVLRLRRAGLLRSAEPAPQPSRPESLRS